MSVLVANPCTSNASPKIYIAETAADIYFPRNGKPGDTVIVTKDSGFEIWKFKAEYDPIGTEGADWIAAKPCGYWVNIGNGEGRFSEFINVQNSPFNAVGDGEEDDTIAIQSAIDFASLFEVGSTILFPPGVYKTTSQLNIEANYVRLQGTNNIGGVESSSIVGATILGVTSGMGAVVFINKAATAIYGVTVTQLRIAAASGLATPPDGLSFKDSSECAVRDCWIGGNLANGIKTNGSDMLRLDRVTISTNEVGIYQTVNGTSVFLGQANVQAFGLNIFEHSEAAVKIDGYIDWTTYRDSFIENTPYGFLFTARSGTDAYQEKFLADGIYFFNGSGSPYLNSRFVSCQAPAGAGNYLGCHNFKIENCKVWCNGATRAVEYLKGTNANAATFFSRQDFESNTFYGVSVAGIYSDSTLASGKAWGSHMVRDDYQAGDTKPLVLGFILDEINIKDFGAVGDGVTDDAAAIQAAVTQGSGSGVPVYAPNGNYRIASAITVPSGTQKLHLYGDGRNKTIFTCRVNGASAFNFGDTTWLELSDFSMEGGDDMTSGHALRLVDPVYNTGTFLPSHVSIQRVAITGFTGADVSHTGAAMPACGVFAVNALECKFSECYFGSNDYGAYIYDSFTVNFSKCTFDLNVTAGIIDQINEALTVDGCDFVGESLSTITLLTASEIDGSTSIPNGHIVIVDSRGTVVRGSKLKNSFAQIVAKSKFAPVIDSNFIVPDVQYGILALSSARISKNTFYPFYLATSTRKYIYFDLPATQMVWAGTVEGNRFDFGGGGEFDCFIEVNAPTSGYPASGMIRGNLFGNASATANATTFTAGVRTTGYGKGLIVEKNTVHVPPNVTISTMFDLAATGSPHASENIIQTDGGTVTSNGVVTPPTYADNVAALAGGLTAGAFYATATGELRVVV